MGTALLRRFLAHPLTASLDIDDPATTELRKKIILSKPFLKAIYDEWYKMIADRVPAGDGRVLELGSGGGHCEAFIPGLLTSDVFPCPGVLYVLDARQLPFADRSLRGIVMTNVLHHMPDVRQFFLEATRCLAKGGRIAMIEPWSTPWARFVYKHFHHEPFSPKTSDWSFPSTGPLSGANMALPWIVFERDRPLFEKEFPELSLELIQPFMPFRYLLSGGVAMRTLMPNFTYGGWVALERMLSSQMNQIGLFALISLRRL
ncbi:MAG TPA: methyltransferase domain-containing protein [Candidatus Saccharimonadales bacterium]|nr:methyltransferase domain-containing protein [Candidatus Saccharimonadales bacterium]